MADLISRDAALEVIEAVKNACWSQSGKVLCGRMYSQIKDLPAVDAVPVEWLKQKMKHPDSYTRGSAKWILGCWKREREAR